MKIKLTKSGGLTGKNLSAEVDWKLTKAEWESLAKSISTQSPKVSKRVKDSFSYQLEVAGKDGKPILFNPNLVPEEYKNLFQALFDGLKGE